MSTASPKSEHAQLIRCLAVLSERPGSQHEKIADALGLPPPTPAVHTDLFVHQLPPYASIYLDPGGKIGGDARYRIAGFFRALRITPPPEPDHLASLLGLSASLLEAAAEETDVERTALLEHSYRALVWEHLAVWLTPYLARVRELGDETYQQWASLVAQVTTPDAEKVDHFELPAHLAQPRPELDGPADLVPYLLTPIRSGILLTRSDLRRAAVTTGLGLRVGERAFSLKSLLDQDHYSVLEWVAIESNRQAELWRLSNGPEAQSGAWSQWAQHTSSIVRQLLDTQTAQLL